MKKTILGTVMCAALLSGGCATILTEDTHKMNVSTSNGERIEVKVDGVSQYAPGIIQIRKENRDKVLVTDAAGCTKQTFLKKEIEPTFFINILTGGAFGSSTDYGSDKMWKYQDSVTVSCN